MVKSKLQSQMILILTLMLVTFPNTVSSSAIDSDDGKCLPGSSECEMQSCRESATHGHHQTANTKIRLIIFFAAEDWRSSIQSAKTRPGADCGSDHELLIGKFRLKLKKVGKTTRPFR